MSYQKIINSGIKRLREQNKLTQEQFAEKIGMSVQGYRNIEHNKYQPTSDTIDKICKVFKVTPIDLLIPEQKSDLKEIRKIINYKLDTCKLEKLLRISSMIDLM